MGSNCLTMVCSPASMVKPMTNLRGTMKRAATLEEKETAALQRQPLLLQVETKSQAKPLATKRKPVMRPPGVLRRNRQKLVLNRPRLPRAMRRVADIKLPGQLARLPRVDQNLRQCCRPMRSEEHTSELQSRPH